MSSDTDRGDRVELGRRYLDDGNVRHGYALTGHAGQGITVERAFVLGSGGARLQEWGYVALSRARRETRLYVTGTVPERESHFHDLDDRDPVTRLGQALEESAIERLAVDQRPLPSGPLHDTRAEIERPLGWRRATGAASAPRAGAAGDDEGAAARGAKRLRMPRRSSSDPVSSRAGAAESRCSRRSIGAVPPFGGRRRDSRS